MLLAFFFFRSDADQGPPLQQARSRNLLVENRFDQRPQQVLQSAAVDQLVGGMGQAPTDFGNLVTLALPITYGLRINWDF